MEKEKIDTKLISIFGMAVLIIVFSMVTFDVYYYEDNHSPANRKIPTSLDDIEKRMDRIENKLDRISEKINQ